MHPPEVTRLHLLRHGEVESRYHRIFGGRIDMELSPRGHEQAAVLARRLAETPLQAIYCSPMRRARQTLAPLAEVTGITPVTLDGLREVDFGEWTGKGWQQVAEEYRLNVFTWLEELQHGRVPGAESGPQFLARVEPCLRRILREHRGGNVAVMCHGGVVRALLSLLLEVPLPHFGKFDIEYASLTTVEVHDHKSEVTLLNLTPWRDLASAE